MGVYTRTTRDGTNRFYIRYFANGRLIREVTPATNLKQAEYYLSKRKVEVEEGKWTDKKQIKRMKFEEYSKEFLELKHLQGLKAISRIELSLRILNEFFGDKIMDTITNKDIHRFINKRKLAKKKRAPHGHLAPATINRELACLRNLLNEARRSGVIESDPMFGIKFMKEDNIRNRCLSYDEEEVLLDTCPSHLYGLVLCALETGMRRGEILKLCWDQVKLKKGFIFLEGADTKTGLKRKIPISSRLHKYLKSLPRSINTNRVFTYRGKGIDQFSSSWNNVREKAKLEDFRFHDLRHTFVTRMRKAGIHDHVIMAITGHKTRDIFLRYDTVDDDDLLGAVHKNCAPDDNDVNEKLTSNWEKGDTPGDTRKFEESTPTRK